MMIGNQFKWEETIASKVGDQASAWCVSSKMWVWHRAPAQRGVDFQVAIISKQSETHDRTPLRFCYVHTYNIYDIIHSLALYLVVAECSNIKSYIFSFYGFLGVKRHVLWDRVHTQRGAHDMDRHMDIPHFHCL